LVGGYVAENGITGDQGDEIIRLLREVLSEVRKISSSVDSVDGNIESLDIMLDGLLKEVMSIESKMN
jgi:hypothetical protein